MNKEDLKTVAETDDCDQADDAAFKPEMAGEIEGKDPEDENRGHESGEKQRGFSAPAVSVENRAEEQVQAYSGAEELGQIGRDCGDFSRCPEGPDGGAGEMLAAVLREGEAGNDAQLGREVLDENRHRVRPEQHPEEAIAELSSAENVGGEVAGVDVGDGGDEGGAKVGPHLVAAEAGNLGAAAAPGGEGSGGGVQVESRLQSQPSLGSPII